ncbi:SusC/RagA family TonB-linked outer membrane protein [Parapedobacter sp. 10938]|uniref:SusC/RagA family TonB-linked outer membrane protein n=1 Tax=Parapedobacter flavus TaxID=3110225 RepID=UPI002DBB523A|nr:SusC/RagA family TonB-linked outer membrane protein [Parapedobacter sp. 10938]MEC3878764.1 SusC/RagA family TonB-linked outer membrane protein [Parapedobacter sp. 10938]
MAQLLFFKFLFFNQIHKRMKQKLLCFFMLGILLIGSAYAQDRRISGTVTSSDSDEPLAGVSVVVTGSTLGTTTDADGMYSISVPDGTGSLTFRYIGYLNQDVAISSSNVLDVVLQVDATNLSEVVVTALGIQREKRSLGYSVQDVKSQDIVNSREPNVVNALAGKIAGVQINNSGGQAGSSSRIVIRGNSSLTGENQPLFVIDGIPIDNSVNRGETSESILFNGAGANRAVDIDPNIIENISVLKGAAASALYGSRGAFGVVLITTKKGVRDANRKYPRISFSSNLAYDNAITEGYQTSYHLGLTPAGGTTPLFRNGLPASLGGYNEDPDGSPQGTTSWGPHKDSVSQAVIDALGGVPRTIDPRKDFYQTAGVWTNSLSISGGGEKSSYILTYTNLDQTGVVPNNYFKKNSLSGNMTTQLSEKFSSSTSVSYTNSRNNRFAEGNNARSFLYGLNFAPITFDSKEMYDEHGNLSWQSPATSATGFNNPYWLVENNAMPSIVDRIIASNELNFDILPWLKLTNRIGLDTYTDESSEHVDIGTKGTTNGRMFSTLIKSSQINNDLILSAASDINDDLSFSALVGTNYNDRKFTRRGVRGLNLNIPGFFDISNAATQQAFQGDSRRRIVGLYASGTLDYKNYLFLNLTARNDWSSTLPKGNNSFFYPSASLSWVFTELLDLQDNPYFSYGKLRLSYAQAGNDASPYLTTQTFAQANPGDGTRGDIIFPFQGVNAFQLSSLMASNMLTPEMVTEMEVGADLRFFKNRLGVEFSYYDKVSDKQILQQEIAGSSGFGSRVINAGEISNKGIELIVSGSPVRTDNFSWDVLVNFSRNRYTLKSIAEGVDNIFLGGFTDPQIRADKDHGYGVIWSLGWKRNDNGDLLIDDDGYPMPADELGPIGNVTPDWVGGIRNTFRYKGLSLSALVDTRQGGDIFNFDAYYTTFYGTAEVTEQRNTYKTWKGVRASDGQPNTTPVLQDQDYFQSFYTTSMEELVEDGSFIKLREVTLSYQLPEKVIAKTPFEDVGISVTGRNLWIKSDFSYLDPEGSLFGSGNAQGFYHAVTPGTRGVTFGLNVRF